MSSFRRNLIPGATFFYTSVTHQRRPILTTDLGRQCLRDAIDLVKRDHPLKIVAIVLLPDHWHTVWTLPPGDDRYPLVKSTVQNRLPQRMMSASFGCWLPTLL